ncbi:hypothetical protein CW745_13990 [Psychromonas sp. psych-6C06]|uniref:hypothetical protein n=1 Tax=Psychromonas sp. psych-6C06 TaxID=2058089 RepID=UPI000C32D30F|nr:hypothetical protein [Psychromonas sp. psych-6C06]PKF60637.1 hypothetical protein CW745_13990 [Psychromonas sp. psych-6C06]
MSDNSGCKNEKALREQGHSILTKTPTTVVKEVSGDYTRFSDIAIGCVQFLAKEPVKANLRVGQTRQCNGVRLSISGRAGRAELFLTSPEQVDELVERLEVLKLMQFGRQGAIE